MSFASVRLDDIYSALEDALTMSASFEARTSAHRKTQKNSKPKGRSTRHTGASVHGSIGRCWPMHVSQELLLQHH